jgi:hypothetical protein
MAVAWCQISLPLLVRFSAVVAHHLARFSLLSEVGAMAAEGCRSAEAELRALCYATAVSASLRQLNSVPSTRMRCMTPARRRARATIAFLAPRRRATCMPQVSHRSSFVVEEG